jgi:hypothetical protein
LSNHNNIKHISIAFNPLTTVTVINNSKLEKVYAYNTTSSCTINCINNSSLTNLLVGESTGLKTLNCYGNTALTSLNLTGCTALTTLDCHGNKLTSLSVQDCNSLIELNCSFNQIKESGANTLVNSLRTIPAGRQGTLKFIAPGCTNNGVTEANIITNAQVRAARTKRWIPMKFVSGSWVEIPSVIPGDVNNDGTVTAADITALYDVLLNNDYSQIVNGDQTGDGVITAADVTAVYTIMLSSKE